jgi:hypothetical protein
MTLRARKRVWAALASLVLGGCGKEYVCPDPIGRIVRDDCDEYRTRYESLKVQLGFSIGGMGFSVGAGKEKIRDPSELLQVLMQQTLTLCKDFNACRVPSEDYRRRREEADRKFTAITAITEQLKGDLDAESKRRLVGKLIDVLSGATEAPPVRRSLEPTGPLFSPGFFRDATWIWFGSRFQPPMPRMDTGVPALAEWSVTASGVGIGADWSSFVHLTFRGKTEVDDRVYLTLSEPALQASEKVAPMRGRPEARASFHLQKTRLRAKGTMTLAYRPGATGQKSDLGTIVLDVRPFLGRGYLAYMPDPVRADPIEYERPWLVFYSRVEEKTRVTVRCDKDGRADDAVLMGPSHYSPYEVGHLRRHHIPLPVRIPLKGGTTRGTWERSVPGEKLVVDRFPSEAAGLWTCRASLNGRVARRFEFRLGPDGSVARGGAPGGKISPPWWPIRTERLDNDVERQREREIADEEAKEEAREQEWRERQRGR